MSYQLKNRVLLIGNLGGAPQVKTLENANKVVKFSIATNETYFNAAGQRVNETQWHNLVTWNKLADIAEKYLTKGMQVAAEGRLIQRSFTDKEGIKRYVAEIHVCELLFLGSNVKREPVTELPELDFQPKQKRSRKAA